MDNIDDWLRNYTNNVFVSAHSPSSAAVAPHSSASEESPIASTSTASTSQEGAPQPQPAVKDKKRRACDACRIRRIRCQRTDSRNDSCDSCMKMDIRQVIRCTCQRAAALLRETRQDRRALARTGWHSEQLPEHTGNLVDAAAVVSESCSWPHPNTWNMPLKSLTPLTHIVDALSPNPKQEHRKRVHELRKRNYYMEMPPVVLRIWQWPSAIASSCKISSGHAHLRRRKC